MHSEQQIVLFPTCAVLVAGKEQMVENEIEVMKLCDHQNICKLIEEYETQNEIYLIMELVKVADSSFLQIDVGGRDVQNFLVRRAKLQFFLYSDGCFYRVETCLMQ